MAEKINKKEYSDKINARLGVKKLMGREIDFSKLKLKDLLDLNEMFMDPVKLKGIIVNVGAEVITGELLEATTNLVGKEGGGGMLNTVAELVEEEAKDRFPILGNVLARARQRKKEQGP